jgi:hypothetical protein
MNRVQIFVHMLKNRHADFGHKIGTYIKGVHIKALCCNKINAVITFSLIIQHDA